MLNTIARLARRPARLRSAEQALIEAAHIKLGLDFADEDDARAFRAAARNAFRDVFATQALTDPEGTYSISTYIWYSKIVMAA